MSYEYITKHSSGNYTPGAKSTQVFGLARRISGIVIHHWGDPANNPSFSGVVSFLCRKGGNTSAHYVIEAGKCSCIVSPKNVAWHAGNAKYNATTIGLELNPRASNADYETAGEVIADIWMSYGRLPLYKHKDIKATLCPGRWNIYKLEKIAQLYFEKKKGKTQTIPNPKDKVKYYTIKVGDTLSSIAQKNNTTVKQLAIINKIKNVNNITAGNKIKLNKI